MFINKTFILYSYLQSTNHVHLFRINKIRHFDTSFFVHMRNPGHIHEQISFSAAYMMIKTIIYLIIS